MSRDNTNDPTPYAVHCNAECGLQFLSEEEYMYQLNHPNSLWICPKCRAIADWDDECQETAPLECDGDDE